MAGKNDIATLRKSTPIEKQKEPNRIPQVINKDIKKTRSYPMQPPIIPHKIRDYEINLNTNKCMTCHDRQKSKKEQAPMVSVTHFMDRDGNFLATVSPRRYFCNQCHVPQTNARSLVGNTFVDMQALIKENLKKSHKE